MRIRIENAKEMLEEKSLSVSEIGEKLGFSSPAYFSDSFKKTTGISPKNYAKSK
jgi:two-component system response regulator YesN